MDDSNNRCNHQDIYIHNQPVPTVPLNCCQHHTINMAHNLNGQPTQQLTVIPQDQSSRPINIFANFSPSYVGMRNCAPQQTVPCFCPRSENYTHNLVSSRRPQPSVSLWPNCCHTESCMPNPDTDSVQSQPPAQRVDPIHTGNDLKKPKNEEKRFIESFTELPKCSTTSHPNASDDAESSEQQRIKDDKRKMEPHTTNVVIKTRKKRHHASKDVKITVERENQQAKKKKITIKNLRKPTAPAALFKKVIPTIISDKKTMHPSQKHNTNSSNEKHPANFPTAKVRDQKDLETEKTKKEKNTKKQYRLKRDSSTSSSEIEMDSNILKARNENKLLFESEIGKVETKKGLKSKPSDTKEKYVKGVPKSSISQFKQINKTDIIDLTNTKYLAPKLSEVLKSMIKRTDKTDLKEKPQNFFTREAEDINATTSQKKEDLKLLNDNLTKNINTDKFSRVKLNLIELTGIETQNKLKRSKKIIVDVDYEELDNKDEQHVDTSDTDLSFLDSFDVDEVVNSLPNYDKDKDEEIVSQTQQLDVPRHGTKDKLSFETDIEKCEPKKYSIAENKPVEAVPDGKMSIEEILKTESKDDLEAIKRYMAEVLGITPENNNEGKHGDTSNDIIEVIDLTDSQTSDTNDMSKEVNCQHPTSPIQNLTLDGQVVYTLGNKDYDFETKNRAKENMNQRKVKLNYEVDDALSIEDESSLDDVMIIEDEDKSSLDDVLSIKGKDESSQRISSDRENESDCGNIEGTIPWCVPMRSVNEVPHREFQNMLPQEQDEATELEKSMNVYLKEKYDVTALIRKGKFSNVYQCNDSNNKNYAVKVVPLNSLRKFSNLEVTKEKILIIQREKPYGSQFLVYLISITLFFHEKQWCYLMEYCPKNLEQMLLSNSCLHIDKVQMLTRQLVAAVTVLKNNKLVHGDIKPNHVLLNMNEDHIKICGFDYLFYCNPKIKYYEPNIGSTKNYRAPEVIMGYSADYKIDVWATGLVIYEMVTGSKLIGGKNIRRNNEVLYKQMTALGDMSREMIAESRWSNKHFVGFLFERKLKSGASRESKKLIPHFNPPTNVIQRALEDSYYSDWGCHKQKEQRKEDYKKLDALERILRRMLVLHPSLRASIESVSTMLEIGFNEKSDPNKG